jgi:hypothetical protein
MLFWRPTCINQLFWVLGFRFIFSPTLYIYIYLFIYLFYFLKKLFIFSHILAILYVFIYIFCHPNSITYINLNFQFKKMELEKFVCVLLQILDPKIPLTTLT